MKARLLSGAIVLTGLCVTSVATSLGASAAAATSEPIPASKDTNSINFYFDIKWFPSGASVTGGTRQPDKNPLCPPPRTDC